jgi:hypothetical protein
MLRTSPIIFVIMIALLASGAQAATTYQYVGNNFDTITDNDPPTGTYTTAMRVTGSFTVSAPLATMGLTDIRASVLSYSFSDGRGTYTESNSSIDEFDVAIDGSGQITNWQVLFDGPRGTNVGEQFPFFVGTENITMGVVEDSGFFGECTGAAAGCDAVFDSAVIGALPGTWSVVPLPAAVWLFGSALGLLGWMKRRA